MHKFLVTFIDYSQPKIIRSDEKCTNSLWIKSIFFNTREDTAEYIENKSLDTIREHRVYQLIGDSKYESYKSLCPGVYMGISKNILYISNSHYGSLLEEIKEDTEIVYIYKLVNFYVSAKVIINKLKGIGIY